MCRGRGVKLHVPSVGPTPGWLRAKAAQLNHHIEFALMFPVDSPFRRGCLIATKKHRTHHAAAVRLPALTDSSKLTCLRLIGLSPAVTQRDTRFGCPKQWREASQITETLNGGNVILLSSLPNCSCRIIELARSNSNVLFSFCSRWLISIELKCRSDLTEIWPALIPLLYLHFFPWLRPTAPTALKTFGKKLKKSMVETHPITNNQGSRIRVFIMGVGVCGWRMAAL